MSASHDGSERKQRFLEDDFGHDEANRRGLSCAPVWPADTSGESSTGKALHLLLNGACRGQSEPGGGRSPCGDLLVMVDVAYALWLEQGSGRI